MRLRIVLFLAAVAALAAAVLFLFPREAEKASRLPAPAPRLPPAPLAFDERSFLPLKLPLREPRIEVDKSARRLYLFSMGKMVRVYPAGLSVVPLDPKSRLNDLRTPEGSYRVCSKNPNSKYYLALGLNYPNDADAERGLSEGLITRAQREAILKANREGGCPPWDTPLGGAIVIHGRGAGADWTAGCIALEDEDIREIYGAVPVGTPVEIRP